MESLVKNNRFFAQQLRAARHYQDTGQDCAELLKNVNAFFLGRGHYIFFDDEGRLTCFTWTNPNGIPVGCRFYFNRWFYIRPDGSRETLKDVSLEDSR